MHAYKYSVQVLTLPARATTTVDLSSDLMPVCVDIDHHHLYHHHHFSSFLEMCTHCQPPFSFATCFMDIPWLRSRNLPPCWHSSHAFWNHGTFLCSLPLDLSPWSYFPAPSILSSILLAYLITLSLSSFFSSSCSPSPASSLSTKEHCTWLDRVGNFHSLFCHLQNYIFKGKRSFSLSFRHSSISRVPDLWSHYFAVSWFFA